MRAATKSSTSFIGFLLRVVISLPLWFLLTAIIAYILLKLLNIEAPLLDAITSLNLSKLYENEFAIGFPATIFSGFLALVIIWALLWRRGY